jgi:alpha-beta hydrolase superfamily lysophospholipase
MHRTDGQEWRAYYERFHYFTAANVRDGCQPRVYRHAAPSAKAVVLVHGLTDSPHFMTAIARHFHFKLGYDVFLPLLHGHGLKAPRGMQGVDLGEWKANVRFAVQAAAAHASRVSIGGLSTGGALSFYMACTKPRITGELYLFSAALDLAGGPLGLVGEFKEWLLGTPLAAAFDSDKPLIGNNPYRYARMDMDGAQELARLIKETDDLLKGFDAQAPFARRVFAAHSECDRTAAIQGIKNLQTKTARNFFTAFYIPAAVGVSHAELVLDVPIRDPDADRDALPLEKANPQFGEMMAALTAFETAV